MLKSAMSGPEHQRITGSESEAKPCVFCSIRRGEAEASIVERDDNLSVIISLEGTPLIFPSRHITRPEEDPELATLAFQKAVELIPSIVDAFGTRDFNIVSNTGKLASQEVSHFHVHVIPRFEGDRAVRFATIERKPRAELETIAQDLQKAIANRSGNH